MQQLNNSEIFRRQRNTYNPDLHNRPIHIIGCGSLGSYIGLFLAKLGLNNFSLYDSDTVSEANVANQAFETSDIGELKTTALNTLLRRNSTFSRAQSQLSGAENRFSIQCYDSFSVNDTIPAIDSAIFLATDSLESRKIAYQNSIKDNWFIDVRTGTEYFSLFAIDGYKKEHREYYEKFALVMPEGGAEDGDCNMQSIAYSTAITAAMAVNAYIRMCNADHEASKPVFPRNVECDLKNFDMHTVWTPKSSLETVVE